MNQPQQQVAEMSVSNPIFKTGSLWALIGITSWSDAASFFTAVASILAALYSLALLSEWIWKRIIRPFCEWRGWMKRQARRRTDANAD